MRAVIFDCEGVLVQGEFLPALARLIGKEDEVREITLRGIQGRISWEEGLFKRISMLKGLPYEHVKCVSDRFSITKGAGYVCNILRKNGFRLILVSGGFTILTDRIKKELSLDYAVANELLFGRGLLAGVKTPLSVTSNKAVSIKNVIDDLRLLKDNIVAVIDGANDLALYDIAALKIGFNAQPIVEDRSDHSLIANDLTFILPIILGHYEQDSLCNHDSRSYAT